MWRKINEMCPFCHGHYYKIIYLLNDGKMKGGINIVK